MSAQKLLQIANWTAEQRTRKVNSLSTQLTTALIPQLEELIEDTLPAEIITLYETYNGEAGDGLGLLLGHQFLSLKEVIDTLQFSKGLVKPKNRFIPDPERSQQILTQVTDLFRSSIPAQNRFGLFRKKWTAASFECGPGNYSGLKVSYPGGKMADAMLAEEHTEQVFTLIKELHTLEKANYNWDNLKFTLLYEGGFEVERVDYLWEEELPLSSCPADAIRLKYFHLKWVPLFSDYGGNYIGVDLDPGPAGLTGQIIVFGRDEEAMFVVADSLDDFFKLLIEQTLSADSILKENLHLHDILRKLVAC